MPKNKQHKYTKTKDKNFWMKLLADGETNTISSKRLCMLLCLIMLVALAILSAFGYNCMEAFVYVFASLAGAQSGFTTIEKCTKSMKRLTRKDNDIDEDSDNDSYGENDRHIDY